jgi:hypothetical protein
MQKQSSVKRENKFHETPEGEFKANLFTALLGMHLLKLICVSNKFMQKSQLAATMTSTKRFKCQDS